MEKLYAKKIEEFKVALAEAIKNSDVNASAEIGHDLDPLELEELDAIKAAEAGHPRTSMRVATAKKLLSKRLGQGHNRPIFKGRV